MELVLVPCEDQVPQAPLILQDPLMKSDRVKTLVLAPLCFVGDVQQEGILSSGYTAFMGHQVHSDEPWPGTVPLSSSLDRDL